MIVIDVMSLICLMQKDKKENLCGNRYWLITEPLKQFFRMLCESGAELIFFKDGPPQIGKMELWNKRQYRRYQDIVQLYECLNKEWSLDDIINKTEFGEICPVVEKLVQTCEKYGTLHVSVDRECDLESARYATEHNAIAIISQVKIYLKQFKFLK